MRKVPTLITVREPMLHDRLSLMLDESGTRI